MCLCVRAFVCECLWVHVCVAFMACRQTYHRTISQSGIQKIAVQVSVFHVGQDDHRGGVPFALHSLQTHTCTNTKGSVEYTHCTHCKLQKHIRNKQLSVHFSLLVGVILLSAVIFISHVGKEPKSSSLWSVGRLSYIFLEFFRKHQEMTSMFGSKVGEVL